MSGRVKKSFVLAAALLTVAVGARADVRLPRIFTDHMVLQREMPVHVWGWAEAGEAVSVALDKDKAAATADALGRWSVTLPARAAGGPYLLVVSGKNTITLGDVLLGDLWVASGQSNMEMPLGGFATAPVFNGAEEIAKAKYPQIRLMHVAKNSSEYPLDDVKKGEGWSLCTPETAKDFSAVAYFFARDLQAKEHVAIGLISSSWGGTVAEAWISLPGLSKSPALAGIVAGRAADMEREEAILLQKAVDDAGAKEGKAPPKRPADNTIPWEPAALYNAMIAPVTKLPVKGVIWYQGESNANQDRAPLYQDVFESLIQDWRERWRQPEMPFLFVQITAFQNGVRDGWPVVRDAQRHALRLKKTGMAVSIDVGEEKQVHPAHKQEIGQRLALLARSVAYGEAVVSSGPLFRSAANAGAAMLVTFDYAEGLKTVGGALNSFEVAGADGVFVKADAVIRNDAILAMSTAVPKPVYVRYAWRGFPVQPNLYNGAGLPASPFTSMSASGKVQ